MYICIYIYTHYICIHMYAHAYSSIQAYIHSHILCNAATILVPTPLPLMILTIRRGQNSLHEGNQPGNDMDRRSLCTSDNHRRSHKPENWNMNVLQPQTQKRRNTSINRPTSTSQLFGVYCIFQFKELFYQGPRFGGQGPNRRRKHKDLRFWFQGPV